MSLADRIARLESIIRPAAAGLPVELEECELFADHAGARTILRSADGALWEQPADEPLDAFKARVKGDAVRGFRAEAGATAVRLVMLRPQIAREQWLAKYSAASTG